MSDGSVPPFDLAGDSGEYQTCTSETYGFVYRVLKCEHHDHWYRIDSTGKYEVYADGMVVMETSADMSLSAENVHLSSVDQFEIESASGDIAITTPVDVLIDADRCLINAELFVPVHTPTPLTKAECVENGMINVSKLFSYYLHNGI